jgi:AcrR family transcriptional regulator
VVRRGRRPGEPDTRGSILAAARALFAEAGYARVTIRRIASVAGVDPALVHHYFGTKEELFANAVDLPFSPAEAVGRVLAGGAAGMGERLAQLFFTVWEAPESREPLIAQLRQAMVDPEAPFPFAEFVSGALLPRAVPHLSVPNPSLRLELAAAHLVGVAILRYVARLEPMASLPAERLVAEVGPRIQTYLEDLPPS